MGTWDDGLLDNDAAYDGLGALQREIVDAIVALGAAKATVASTEELCAAVGILLQLSAHDFGLDTDSGPKIVSAVSAHAANLAKLPPAAREVMAAVMDGRGMSVGERRGQMSLAHARLLHAGATQGPFGAREDALFSGKAAAAYVQSIARRCVETIDGDFEDESNWSDLCREATGMGLIGVLMVLAPCTVPPAKVVRWRELAKKGLATLEEEQDDELDFHRAYYANLDAAFGVLAERFG